MTGCLVGAGSVVTRDLPPGTVAYGNPREVHGPGRSDLPDVGESGRPTRPRLAGSGSRRQQLRGGGGASG